MVRNVEENGVIIKYWSDEMLDAFGSAWDEVVEELKAQDPFFAEVWADLEEYRAGYAIWATNEVPRRTK